VRLTLAPAVSDESQKAQTASLFRGGDKPLSPHERKIYALLQGDEATHIDEIVERLEAEMSLSEIFAAPVRARARGKGEAIAGKEFCETSTHKFPQERLGAWKVPPNCDGFGK